MKGWCRCLLPVVMVMVSEQNRVDPEIAKLTAQIRVLTHDVNTLLDEIDATVVVLDVYSAKQTILREREEAEKR